MSGKGSAPRPYSVPKESFDQSYERIFGGTNQVWKTCDELKALGYTEETGGDKKDASNSP